MSQPIVSIITTVYNRANFLEECILSIQKSKLKEYEHIIVDDASSDSSVAIAQKYAKADSRIKIFINPTNIGDYPNRNKGARYATGKYIKYVDADDMLGPWTLNIMVDSMELFPSAALGLFVYGIGATHSPRLLSSEATYKIHYMDGIRIFNRSPLSAIINRDRFMEIEGFSKKQHVGDFQLWHALSAAHPVVLLPSLIAHYRVHSEQQSVANRSDTSVPFKYFQAAIEGMETPEINHLSQQTRHQIKSLILKKQARAVLIHLFKGNFALAAKLKSRSNHSWAELVQNSMIR